MTVTREQDEVLRFLKRHVPRPSGRPRAAALS
jgi:hypothetical protein